MKAVFFDLDGTLTDPFRGITRCIQHALRGIGAPQVPSASELAWCIGPPLHESLVRLVGRAQADSALTLYRERFDAVGWRENAVYEGIPDTLERLHRAGLALYVATSKPRLYAERIVGHFGLAAYFRTIFGAELDGRNADKSDLLAVALATSGARNAAMVGDRSHDMMGARNNGLHPIGVSYGYGTPAELNGAGAAAIADSPRAIADLLLTPVPLAG